MREAPVLPGPLLGHCFAFRRDPLGFLTRATRRHGHIFRFRILGREYYHHLSHPDYLDHVLRRRYLNYPKRRFGDLVSIVSGKGVLALEGDAWARQRKLMQPAFHRDRLAGFAAVMRREAADRLDRWDRLEPRPRRIEPHAEFLTLTLSIVGRALVGSEMQPHVERLNRAFLESLVYLHHRLEHPLALPLWAPTPINRRYRTADRTIHGVLTRLVDARRRSPGGHDDLLAMLLDARDEQAQALPDSQIREELRTMFMAGYETTAAVLFWCVYLLGRHADHERRLHDEVDAIPHPPSFDDLPRLRFTRAVVDEAMRLYPSVVWQARIAAEDDEIGGFRIPSGGPVAFSFYVMHRHPDFWERPDDFEPDRFAPGRADRRHPGAYLPFGLGPRQCMGNSFALMETQIVLAAIAQRYRLRPESDEPIQPEILGSLRPRRGVMMRLEPR